MKNKRIFRIIELIIIVLGLGFLLETDAYFTPHLLIGGLSVVCMFTAPSDEKPHILTYISPIVFALAVTGANYPIWAEFSYPDEIGVTGRFVFGITMFLSVLVGSYLMAFHILKALTSDAFRDCIQRIHAKESTLPAPHPAKVFLVTFLSISAIDISVLFLCRYPGVVTSDSLTQIKMFMEGWYNNHHPFYHNQVIRIFMGIGLMVFHDFNAAIATYSVFQILFMAACFSSAVMTLSQMKLPKAFYVIPAIIYAIFPHHINYSFSMWKDVMFGGIVLGFCVYYLRLFLGIGKKIPNCVLLALFSLGACLFRSNGYIMFLIVVIIHLLIFRKEIFSKKSSLPRTGAIIFAGTLIAAFILKHPVLHALDVSQPDTVEMLCIPLQQISRTIIENDDLTQRETELIEEVVSPDRRKEVYHPLYADPEKDLIRHEGNQMAIKENVADYAFLYITLGLKHPGSYLKAWVDQTRGYWNSGYDYWRWIDDTTSEEGYDIYRTVFSDFFARHFYAYQWFFENNPFLVLFLCIGLNVWMVWVLFHVSFVRGNRIGCVIAMPIIALVFTLQISAPVYSEFRYVYSVFCAIPFLIPAVVFSGKDE